MSANLAQATLSAYERWAPIYPPVAHNPLMRAEQQAMLGHWPQVAGCRALDLACGTGRYARLLAEAGAQQVVALDFCAPMLQRVGGASRVCASMMQLPFAGPVFDVVISGLAIGHATQVGLWMAEIARVLEQDGTLLYSDFHPEAARAGLTRSFKDADDRTCTVPHRCFEVASQTEAVAAAGLSIEIVQEIRVGMELQEPFPDSEDFYRQWHGLPIVLIVRARKVRNDCRGS
jgi:ubiquinone/menaquinone biosynthesis C-methylase UbiE